MNCPFELESWWFFYSIYKISLCLVSVSVSVYVIKSTHCCDKQLVLFRKEERFWKEVFFRKDVFLFFGIRSKPYPLVVIIGKQGVDEKLFMGDRLPPSQVQF